LLIEGHILAAMLNEDSLARQAHEASDQFRQINVETILRELPALIQDSSEQASATSVDASTAAETGRVRPGSKTPSLSNPFILIGSLMIYRFRESKIYLCF